jgi:hypothetical protein
MCTVTALPCGLPYDADAGKCSRRILFVCEPLIRAVSSARESQPEALALTGRQAEVLGATGVRE